MKDEYASEYIAEAIRILADAITSQGGNRDSHEHRHAHKKLLAAERLIATAKTIILADVCHCCK